jgi:hypothetical protein
MPNKSQPKDEPTVASTSPDNPSLAATGEYPHSAQQEGQGEGVKDSKPKSKDRKEGVK